jgi:hypothetical protein
MGAAFLEDQAAICDHNGSLLNGSRHREHPHHQKTTSILLQRVVIITRGDAHAHTRCPSASRKGDLLEPLLRETEAVVSDMAE